MTATTFLVEDLIFGLTYEFKVEARNVHGYSAQSDTLALLCAYKPDPPLTLATVNTENLVSVSWSEPVANGSPVYAYKVLIMDKSGLYAHEPAECDGTQADVVAERKCSISLATL